MSVCPEIYCYEMDPVDEEEAERLLKIESEEKEKRNKTQAKTVTEQFENSLNALPKNTVKSSRLAKEEAVQKLASRSKGDSLKLHSVRDDIEMGSLAPTSTPKVRGAGVSTMV